MTTWRRVKLETVCTRITVGHVGSMATEYVKEGIPFLRSQNIAPFRVCLDDVKFIPPEFHQRLSKSALRPGDVAVVRTGNPGVAAVVPAGLADANCADLVVITPSSGDLDPHYLAAVFNSTWGKAAVSGNLVGVAQQHFNIGAARNLLVELPAITVQRRIAGILSAYDELIENCERRISVLDRMARALYREWFVDQRSPACGRQNAPLRNGVLGDLLTLQRGYDLPERQRMPGQVPIISSSGSTGTHNVAKVQPPSVVTGRYGTLGEVFFVSEPCWPLNTTLYVSDFKQTDPHYAFFLLRSLNLGTQNSAGAVPGVNRNALHLLPVKLPDAAAQAEFGRIASEQIRLERGLRRQAENLRRTRELLLPRLLSGQLSVEDAA